MIGEKQKLSLYVHTHWDREWYWAFERYRSMLVSVMKLTIDALERGELPSFHLDGQVCALEDFLELEPGFTERIKKLNGQGRLSIGPWYVLADQMLVGGESLVRNLEYGIKAARRIGEPMLVGYSPDTFGHSQDLPRILKGFGIDNALVWRGVPALDQGPEFFWRSPDGSEVVAILLARGYYQTMFHEADGSLEPDKIDGIVAAILPWLGLKLDKERDVIECSDDESHVYSRYTRGCLIPVGGDHIKPPKNFERLVGLVTERLAALIGKGASTLKSIELATVQLSDYLDVVSQVVRQPATPVREISGELRDNVAARQHSSGYMLPGVLSTRLYLKRANRILEHRLSRISEPLHAMMSVVFGMTRYPASELDNAWKYLLKNHPHDSMCGCSVDEVHAEMMTRFASIHQILDVLDQRVRQDLLEPGVNEWSHESVTRVRQDKPAVLNFAGFGRRILNLPDPDVLLTGMAAFNFSTERVSAPVKVCLSIPPSYLCQVREESRTDGKPVRSLSNEDLRIGAERYLTDLLGVENVFQIESVGFETELFGDLCGMPLYKDVNFVEAYLWLADAAPLGMTKLCLDRSVTLQSKERVLASTSASADAVGPRSGKPSQNSQKDNQEETGFEPVTVKESTSISNGIVTVRVSGSGEISAEVFRANGGKTKYDLRHSIVDVADAGDSYNFDPVVNDKPVKARFKSCEIYKRGPLVGALKLSYLIDLPEGLVENPDGKTWTEDFEGARHLVCFKRSQKLVEHEIETIVSLKRGDEIVHFETTWNNQSTDHRLEVVFDTGASVEKTWSENHYSLVERRVAYDVVELPVDKWTESPLDRFPCQRFFVANGQVFLNVGLPEYSVQGSDVSLTILRAISMLSRQRLLTRGGGAGPYMPVPEANSLGVNKVTYGWAPLLVHSHDSSLDLSDWQRVSAYRLAERFEGVLWATPITAESEDFVSCGSKFEIDNANVRFVTSYSQDCGKSLLLRLLNVSLQPQEFQLTVALENAILEVQNLAGKTLREVAESDGKFKLACGVNELLTLRISVA